METVPYHRYFHTIERESKIIKFLKVFDHSRDRLSCPKCLRKHKDIPHGKNITCKCGLYMEHWGNALSFCMKE